ncbi:putative glucose-6-phosphate 1-epimerase [Physcomitrium patens]|uniref:glucose-6-phosphate 1-epimerase n=1 Tax=Physcomitrium patens TaxID=3218 RepID=A9RQG4_PHYPA|nr:putative glucose-6-phosphate 1-epimerase [Physcomitrium patens]PNR60536.1 hypothetical protein PHYPA_003329 [Physcomitrium patens]|eukprot:XP_024368896.1 putative glucose-6-phosphate 1-epimerase [Physcomitrella patens]
MALLKLSSTLSTSAVSVVLSPPRSSSPASLTAHSNALSWKRSSLPSQASPLLSTMSSRALPSGVASPCASQATGVSAKLADDSSAPHETKGVKVQSGEGGLTKVVLSSPDGSNEAQVYLFGACITSWKTSDGKDLLFVRPDAIFTGQKPISGGIPHCFPQFGPGPIQQHGFARNMLWVIESAQSDDETTTLVLSLQPSDYSRKIWLHEFSNTYKIVLGVDKLTTELTVKNTDTNPFSFTAALHSYFRADISKTSVAGLKGCTKLDKPYEDPANPIQGLEDRNVIEFPGFVDTMYKNTPDELLLDNGLGTKISVRNDGWTDAVLWNPHLTLNSSYKDFVCVENAQLVPVELQPGESWTAKQYLNPV